MYSSNQPFSHSFPPPVSIFEYPQSESATADLPKLDARAEEPEELLVGITLTEEALAQRLSATRAEAVRQTEARLRQEYETRETERVAATVSAFERERAEYFTRVEKEVVQLALAIAGKILHREAQVDPMLVAALVRVALTQLKDGSPVTIRVRPEAAGRWRAHFAAASAQNLKVTILEDAELAPDGCILETELGTANFSLDAQLKEVEQGFFDVLAQRP